MGSEPSTWIVLFSAPGTCCGNGRVYTSYMVAAGTGRALEESAAFLGARVDSGTFEETSK